MFEDIDWSQAEQHMLEKHHVTVEQANEALRDPDRMVLDPDYASETGLSVRIIGYSQTVGDLLSIIVLEDEGVEYGVNGWLSNSKDRRIYRGWFNR